MIQVYRGQDGDIDFDNPVAVMAEQDTEVSITGLDWPPNTIWHIVRCAISDCDCQTRSEPSEPCIIRIDSNGEMVEAMPNAPVYLAAAPLIGGKIRLQWMYLRERQEVAPDRFQVYIDDGGGFDFSEPAAEIDYSLKREFQWTSEPLVHGQRYKFCVRSARQGAAESQNTNFVAAVADSEGPDAITNLYLSVEEDG